ncbi:MAG: hypothetical protein D6791_04970 [Chloroflexi bacterium]|nr:MAG: hypothetical protein D6791_04970 [Chloroflexota bacterium]
MEIDVRSFAYRGLMVTDSRCITCGACAEVCPRGTLSLVDRPRMASVLSESGQEEDLPSTLGLQPAFALRS